MSDRERSALDLQMEQARAAKNVALAPLRDAARARLLVLIESDDERTAFDAISLLGNLAGIA